MKKIIPIFIALVLYVVGYSQAALKWRLTATTYNWIPGEETSDSTSYIYHHPTGSVVKPFDITDEQVNPFSYWSAEQSDTSLFYDIQPPNKYNIRKTCQKINSLGNVDTTFYWSSNDFGQTFETASYDVSKYDATGKRSQFQQIWILNGTWVINYQENYTYNTSGKLSLKSTKQNINNVFQNMEKISYTYVGANKTEELYQKWDLGVWANNEKRSYYYTLGSANCDSMIIQKWETQINDWLNYKVYRYTYNPANACTEKVLQFWNNAYEYWSNNERYRYEYDAAGNDTAIYTDGWSGVPAAWQPYDKWFYQYNSDTLLTMIDRIIWDANTSTYSVYLPNAKRVHYFYEQYDPNAITSINTINAANPALGIYPNPTNSILNIRVRFNQATYIRCVIYDLQGRQVMQWNENASSSYKKALSIEDISAGNYVLTINSIYGNSSMQFTIAE